MPKIKVINGVYIQIWPNDHLPVHFHVLGPGINFKVDLKTFEIVSGRYHRKAKNLLRWAKLNQTVIQAEWEKIHG